jgi:hypothetical protein
VQGAILPGYHADIVVWKPEAEFQLGEGHSVYHKHRVCSLPQTQLGNSSLCVQPMTGIFPFVSTEYFGVHRTAAFGQGPVDFREGKPCVR